MPECIVRIKEICSTYKILDGELCSPEKFREIELKRKIIPLHENQKCSVCYNDCIEKTNCNHYLCLKCRIQILKKNKKCPTCRITGIQYYDNNDTDDDDDDDEDGEVIIEAPLRNNDNISDDSSV